MNKIKAILLDDEPNALALLQNYFEKYFPDQVNIISTFTDSIEAFSFISTHEEIDLVVFDINMPKMNGLELLEAFPNRNFEAVFITAHIDFTLDAFKNQVLDYILKPIDRLEFIQSMKKTICRVNKLRGMESSRRGDRFSVTHNGDNVFIFYSDLLYLKADGSYTKIETVQGSYLISKNLKHTCQELEWDSLLKVNRSYVINLTHVVKYSKHHNGALTLSNNYEIGISRNLKKVVLAELEKNQL